MKKEYNEYSVFLHIFDGIPLICEKHIPIES